MKGFVCGSIRRILIFTFYFLRKAMKKKGWLYKVNTSSYNIMISFSFFFGCACEAVLSVFVSRCTYT